MKNSGNNLAPLAQRIEQQASNLQVGSSILPGGTSRCGDRPSKTRDATDPTDGVYILRATFWRRTVESGRSGLTWIPRHGSAPIKRMEPVRRETSLEQPR